MWKNIVCQLDYCMVCSCIFDQVTKLFSSNFSDAELYSVLVDFIHFMYFR